MNHEINETQEVEEILRLVDDFRLLPESTPPRQGIPLSPAHHSLMGGTNFSISAVSPSSVGSRSGGDQHQSSSMSSVHQEDDRYEAEQWSEESKDQESVNSDYKHLQLQGARHFLDPSLFVDPATGVAVADELRKATKILQDAHTERERVRRWAENMRKAVGRWVRDEVKAATVSVRTLEDQHAEAIETCRKQAEIIKQLECQLDDLKRNAATNSLQLRTIVQEPTAPFQTPTRNVEQHHHHHQHHEQPESSIRPPPTVSPPSPLSDNSRNRHGEDSTRSSPHTFYDPLETTRTTNKSDQKPTRQQRKRRFRKDGCQVIEYSNGATREIYADHEVLRHRNNDVEIIYPDHSRYYYTESKTLRITDAQKTTYLYSNSQSEIHWNDGRKLVRFADGSMHEVEDSIAATI
jgi:hypothetical protein